VLARFEHALEIYKALITVYEITINFRRDLAGIEQTSSIQRANLTVRG
jgi:hypothetical protein